MKKLPIGIQTFEKLINDDHLYVDKTKLIYQLIQTATVYFLSRPRRFGKSLLLSTLEAIFKGKKELFKGLWIYDQPFDWQEYPVIRIDFSKKHIGTCAELKEFIINELQDIAKHYNIALVREYYDDIFAELIKKLTETGKVVVLVDEYDKPILGHITDIKTAKKIQETLKGFYAVLKASDEYLKFVFLTGVSKFSKVGVFSGLNNLNDITMNENYAELLGYTQQELEHYFVEEISILKDKEGLSSAEILTKIQLWYNGYRFSQAPTSVYNPFSTLLLFNNMSFKNYWFESGTPTFLLNLIKAQQYDIRNLSAFEADESVFTSYELDHLGVEALLYQTGYLTIKKFFAYSTEDKLYTLDYPNFEVEDSFLKHLTDSFGSVRKEIL